MSGRWKRILALGAAVVLCLIAAAQMGSLFHWKVTCTPAAFAESSRRLSNPDRGFYYIYGYRITDEPVDYATDLRDRTREDDATRLGMMQINLREYGCHIGGGAVQCPAVVCSHGGQRQEMDRPFPL